MGQAYPLILCNHILRFINVEVAGEFFMLGSALPGLCCGKYQGDEESAEELGSFLAKFLFLVSNNDNFARVHFLSNVELRLR
jgi:hypothetical protein